jgi:hypothetical protein
MQTTKHNPWQDLRIHMLYMTFGLSAFTLLVTWSVEMLATALFLNW